MLKNICKFVMRPCSQSIYVWIICSIMRCRFYKQPLICDVCDINRGISAVWIHCRMVVAGGLTMTKGKGQCYARIIIYATVKDIVSGK